MNFNIFIGNTEVVCNQQFEITEEMLATSSVTLNNVYPKSWEDTKDYVSNFYYPKDYSLCRILQDNNLIFAGVVKKTGNISLNPFEPHYCNIQVLDFKTFLSEGDTLNFVINNKTIGEAIEMVIDAIASYGFVLGELQLSEIDEIIGAYSTDKKTAYDVFQYICDITNSKWFTRMIDEDTVAIDFYDVENLPVKETIEYNSEWFEQNLIDDISYSISTDDYRNKQIMLSEEVFGGTNYDDILTSNGYSTDFATQGKIGVINSAKINGVIATFTTNANKDLGIEADIYYTPGEAQITTANQLTAGETVEINYVPLVNGREIIMNDVEIQRISGQLNNRNGIISRYEDRNDTTSSQELQQIGKTYIKYKGQAEVTLKITSRSNLYNIGDLVSFNAPLPDLTTQYMVKKKTTKFIASVDTVWYTFELSSNFNSESAINYFDNQRSKQKGNLNEGDFITRNVDISNSANIIWHDTVIEEQPITGDNTLDCALDSPFIS